MVILVGNAGKAIQSLRNPSEGKTHKAGKKEGGRAVVTMETGTVKCPDGHVS